MGRMLGLGFLGVELKPGGSGSLLGAGLGPPATLMEKKEAAVSFSLSLSIILLLSSVLLPVTFRPRVLQASWSCSLFLLAWDLLSCFLRASPNF